jgi:hypothetical protein
MAPARHSDEAHAKAAAKSRRRVERLKSEGRCVRCAIQMAPATGTRCAKCLERDSSRNRMRAIRARQTDAEREAKNREDREYYNQKRVDPKWRARKWDRNATNAIRRRFQFEGAGEWVEIANQIRLLRRALGRGSRGRPPLRVAPDSPSAE